MAFREPVMSEHAKKILKWRGSFLELEENVFSETMRTYLGEIKTPYNKHKLIENLESFLRQKEHLVAIKSLVTPQELELICAIVFIPDCTEEKLTLFFENTFSFSFLYETVNNLEERLIIFRYEKDGEIIIDFNPLLENAFYDLINVNRLLSEVSFKETKDDTPVITPEFIACFISFVMENPNLSKQDRSLKKHTVEIATEIFGQRIPMFEVVFNAFLNLGILKENGKGVDFDWNKLDKFVQQSFAEQLIYIVVSSAGHFSRENLKVQAQLLVDTIKNLQGISFTKDLFLRTGFLVAIRPRAQEVVKTSGSRFSKILEENRAIMAAADPETVKVSQTGGLERMFDAACNVGLLGACGITDEKKDVYTINKVIEQNQYEADTVTKGMITVDPGMTVNLMPGFALKDVLPIVKFMTVTRYDTVSSFMIDRQSIMRGFDFGLTSKSILALLEERAAFPIPDTLSIQLEEWNDSYSTASFYRGFVLKLDGKAALAAEHNSVLVPHIHTVIAPGIYLLDIKDDEEAIALIKKSKLDFVGKIKTARIENQSPDFFKLNLAGRKINDRTGFEVPDEIIETEDADKITDKMYAALGKLKLPHEQKEGLELRILHKVIVNSSQLNPAILRLERVNANAMDFSGKVYIIDLAIKAGERIEMTFSSGELSVEGVPLSINKRADEAYVEILVTPGNVVREYAIGKASSVRRLRKHDYINKRNY